MNSELRKDCPVRSKTGRCRPSMGNCEAVPDKMCKALRRSYESGCADAAKLVATRWIWRRKCDES